MQGKLLGVGANKQVYDAFDEREGIEVAWNEVILGTEPDRYQLGRRLTDEINILQRLRHKNIIR